MTTEIVNAARAANPSEVLAAIKSASRETGSDFDYLLATAQRESNLDNTAKSRSSSAAGLFQFIEQTWLSLIKRYGTDHGLGRYADAISQTESGRLIVGSPETKSAILALREDPEISALMAGEAAAATKQSLECALGREVCAGELYAAHFLGEGSARKLIGLNEQHAGARADLAFPEAAKANRNVFYHANGTAKTVAELHAWVMGQAPGQATDVPQQTSRPMMIAESNAARAANALPTAAPTVRPAAQEGSFGITVRGSRFTFSGVGTDAPKADHSLPRPPLVLSAGLLDILAAAIAAPSLVRRQT